MTLRLAFLIALVVGALGARPASAEGPGETVAEALFRQARDDMRRNEFAEAYPKLVESQRMGPSSGTLLNLMICEEQLGKVASAWLHGRELLQSLAPTDERNVIAARHVAALTARVPTLTVRLAPTAPADARVILDGLALGPSSLGVTLPIDPGSHRVVVTVPGREDRVASIDVTEAGVYEHVAEPPEAATPDPAATLLVAPVEEARPASRAATTPASSKLRTVGWSALATGVAGLVASGVLGLLTFDREQTVRNGCPAKQCINPSGLQAAEEGRVFLAGAVVALSAGVTGTGLGVYLLNRRGPAVVPAAGAAMAPGAASAMMIRWTSPF